MVSINKCLMGIKTDIATIKTDIQSIKKDINGIVPKVDKYGVDIGVLKSEIINVKNEWVEKEKTFDNNVGFYKTVMTVLSAFDVALITLLGIFLMV